MSSVDNCIDKCADCFCKKKSKKQNQAKMRNTALIKKW